MFAEIPPWAIFPGVVFVLPLVVWYAFWAYLFGPKLAVRQLARVILIFVVVLVPLFAFFASIPASWRDGAGTVLHLLCAAVLWVFILAHLHGRTKAGRVLLDIGRSGFQIALRKKSD